MRFGAFALLMFLMLAAGPGLAQTVVVRSGEHADFSRLVFDSQAEAPWTLGRGPDGYLLRFEDPGLDFAFDRVFDLIPRTRLRQIGRDDEGRVVLSVAEDVHAEAFTLRPGILVLDLRDGPAPPQSPFEAPLDPAPGIATPAPPPEPRPTVRLPMDIGRLSPPAVIGRFVPPEVESHAETTDPRVATARAELMKQIGRAAAQGLLEAAELPRADPHGTEDGTHAADDHAADHQTTDDQTADDHAADTHAAPGHGTEDHAADDPHGMADRPNMRIETSMDRGYGALDTEEAKSALGDPCYPDSYFDIAAWGGDMTPAELIAERRGAFLNMRDAPDPEGTRNLVRAYLSLGFGAEARSLIDTVGMEGRYAPVWHEMGTIIDTGSAGRPEVFDGQHSCPSRASLWAVLSRPELPRGTRVDDGAVLRSFSELPMHLRRHLGPILADRFLAAGDEPVAIRVRNAVARAGAETHSEDLTLVEAKLDLKHGDTQSARSRIGEVLAEGGLSSADALVLQLETDLEAGNAPAPDTLALAEALAFERRGAPMGNTLLSLAIRGHAAGGNFQTAFGMLSHHGLTGAPELASDLVLALAQRGSDADLLREAFSGIMATPGVEIAAEARLAVADRLLALGFADRAARIIDDVSPTGAELERMVRARLALAQRVPGLAIQYLAGIDTPEAERLRADAARMGGDLVSAARHYGAAGDTETQAALAWQSRDWPVVDEVGPDDQRGYSELRDDTPAASLDEAAPPSLSGARDLLSGSEAMRARLEDLITSPAAGF